MLKEASRLYVASWVRDIGPELRPNDYKKNAESEDKPNGEKSATKEREPSTLEDLGKEYCILFAGECLATNLNDEMLPLLIVPCIVVTLTSTLLLAETYPINFWKEKKINMHMKRLKT